MANGPECPKSAVPEPPSLTCDGREDGALLHEGAVDEPYAGAERYDPVQVGVASGQPHPEPNDAPDQRAHHDHRDQDHQPHLARR